MSRPVALCADDYALSPGVGEAIRELVARGRLSATGCMTVSPFWPTEAPALRSLAGRLDVGLHLTLTDHAPLGPMPTLAPDGRLPALGRLTRLALTGRLVPAEIEAEVSRQVTRFHEHFGAPPAFIDGHQHVHLLPVARQAVLRAARRLPGPWLRDCHESLPAILRRGVAPTKAAVISGLGRSLHRAIARGGLAANHGFRGVYDLTGRVPFADLMERFLDPPEAGPDRIPLIMVHPGFPDAALRRVDPVTDQRHVEFELLSSDRFAEMLGRRGLTLARLGGCGEKTGAGVIAVT